MLCSSCSAFSVLRSVSFYTHTFLRYAYGACGSYICLNALLCLNALTRTCYYTYDAFFLAEEENRRVEPLES